MPIIYTLVKSSTEKINCLVSCHKLTTPSIHLRMPLMLLPILYISFSQFLIPDHKQILSILLLSSLREIEGPGNHGLPINNHHLVVGYGVLSIYFHRYPLVIEKSG